MNDKEAKVVGVNLTTAIVGILIGVALYLAATTLTWDFTWQGPEDICNEAIALPDCHEDPSHSVGLTLTAVAFSLAGLLPLAVGSIWSLILSLHAVPIWAQPRFLFLARMFGAILLPLLIFAIIIMNEAKQRNDMKIGVWVTAWSLAIAGILVFLTYPYIRRQFAKAREDAL